MIVTHNSDYEEFKSFLDVVVMKLNEDALARNDYYLSRSGTKLEQDIVDMMKATEEGQKFEVELIAGQKFPDIIAYIERENAFGVEVKTTKSEKWKSVGSSIMEGSRVNDVSRIHLLFAKLSDQSEFRQRLYEDCLYNVAITHSPRYLIDMDTKLEDTIFSKINVDYDTLRRSERPFQPIKAYLRKQLKGKEDVWWTGEDEVASPNIRLWASISSEEQESMKALGFAYFPKIMDKRGEYGVFASYLISRFGILDHGVRDTFSAGKRVEIYGEEVPKKYERFQKSLEMVYRHLDEASTEDLAYFWGCDLVPDDFDERVQLWRELVLDVVPEGYEVVVRKILDKD